MTTLADAVVAWLPSQRWYAGKGLVPRSAGVDVVATLQPGDPAVLLAIAEVEFDDRTDRYQVPVSVRSDRVPEFDHAYVGEAEVDGRTVHLYDAPHDPGANLVWLRLLAAGGAVDGVSFEGTIEGDTELPARPLAAEQSNTSVNYGDRYLFKIYRRLAAGTNPELEVTRALATIGSTHVPVALGWSEGLGMTLGLLQPFVKGATEGWALALTSVRDLYAESDLHAEEVGGDFAPESHRLGVVTAAVHDELARALPTRMAGPDDTRATVEQLRDRLQRGVLSVPDLAKFADGIAAAYDELELYGADVPVQRIHGDFHLGQVLRTDTGWMVTDFEGEPARSLDDRRALMSPLRDVAGMLRSFEYAARHLLADHPRAPSLVYRAAEWSDRNRDAFCDGYAEQCGSDPRTQAVLLRAFELDKAVYEAIYEARHRPSWLSIPLAGIERLIA